MYRRWQNDLAHAKWLDFTVLQLPGRETRIRERPHNDLAQLLKELEWAVGAAVDRPYALFGYSMGALLAYELAVRLAESHAAPERLLVAARCPPWRNRHRPAAIPSRDALLAWVRRLGATATELLDTDLFIERFLPTLEADIRIVDGFARDVPQILPCPIDAFSSDDDAEVSIDDMRCWETAAGSGFRLHRLGGGHFFLHRSHNELIALINQILGSHASSGGR